MNQDIYVVVEHLRGQVADISYIMLGAARTLAQATGGKVVAVLLGYNAQALADTLAADQVMYLDHPALADFTSDAYQRALTHLISEQKPHVVLLGGTSIGSDVAGALSARLGLPLVSSCYSATSDGTLTSMICGGKIVAETGLPETSTLITMIPGAYKPQDGQGEKPPQVVVVAVPALDGLRVTLKGYIEPEAGDVDIAREPVLIAVGRGIQRNENLELAEALAQAIGGVVCASRPVVDQGWLPTSRLVGKSGKRVKAKLYLAIGISGAPEHVEGLGDTEMIIAVNTDPTAPIFNVAKYGTTADLFDLVPVLTEKVREARVAEVRG